VNVYDTTGALLISFPAFPGFGGGAHVATGDVNGDGAKDLIVGAGPGGAAHVKVYDGATLALGGATAQIAVDNPLKSFFAYGSSVTTGVNVAAGDINGDGQGDIVTAPGSGVAAHVKVFNFLTLAEIYSFYAYDPSIACGATVAAGNVGGDSGTPPAPSHAFPSDELITGAGAGGGPHVKIYGVNLTDATQIDTLGQFYAYNPSYAGGVNVASGIVTRNVDPSLPVGDPNFNFPFADIVVGPGANLPEGPLVEIFRLDTGQNSLPGFQFQFVQGASFLAYGGGFTGGVNVAVTPNLDGDADNTQDFITGAGPGGGPHIIVWGGKKLADLEAYVPPDLGLGKFAYSQSFTGGVFVA